MRPTWKGVISFGLVNIPVAVYPATEDKELHFHQLHNEDGGRVSYDKVCKVCGRSLEQEDIVKGYEYEKGKYVTLTDDDLDKVELTTAHAISIQQFVDVSALDPVYLDKAYYLGPEELGKVPYALLVEALKRSKKVGIAKLALRGKEYLAAIRPSDHTLVLNTMHFPDEIRKPEGIGIPEGEVQLGDRELEMADVLIDRMTDTFHPDQYEDNYRRELMEMIQSKIEGQPYEPEVERPQPTNVVDILSRLKASVEQAEEKKIGAAI